MLNESSPSSSSSSSSSSSNETKAEGKSKGKLKGKLRREIEKGQISHGSKLKRALLKRAQGRGLGVHWRHLKKEGEDGDKES